MFFLKTVTWHIGGAGHFAYLCLSTIVKDSSDVLGTTTLPQALLLCGSNSYNNSAITVVASSGSKTCHICMRIWTLNMCINVTSNVCRSITSNIYKMRTTFSVPLGGLSPARTQQTRIILHMLHVILMHILFLIFMHLLDVLIRIHIFDVLLLLLLATTVIAWISLCISALYNAA